MKRRKAVSEFSGKKKLCRRLTALWVLFTLAAFGTVLLILQATGVLPDAEQQTGQELDARMAEAGYYMQVYLEQLAAGNLGLSESDSCEIELLLRRGMNCEIAAGPVVTVLAPLENGQLLLTKGLTGGASGDNPGPEDLMVHQGRAFNTYTGENGHYVGVQQLMNISPVDSACRQWAAALLVPYEAYSRYADAGHRKMVVICLSALSVLILLSLLLYGCFMKRLHKSWQKTRQEQKALSQLVEFVRSCPQKQNFEAEQLPAEIKSQLKRFSALAALLEGEQRELFLRLVQGCTLEQLPRSIGQSRHSTRQELTVLCRYFGVRTPEEILLYIDFCRRCSRMDRLETD